MNLSKKLLALVTVLLAGLAVIAMPAPATAAPVQWSYVASTGGTYVKLLDGTVESDFTAQSSVSGGAKSSSSQNSTAAANVGNVVDVGAIQTTTSATVTSSTTTLKSWARTAHVNLLNGLITADAVTTAINTTGYDATGTGTHTANSTLAGIKIAGIKLPLNIPKNYTVTIPGIANVTLNYSLSGKVDRVYGTMGWAIGVSLIKPRAGYPTGVTLIVNPVNQYLSEADPSEGAGLFGTAYGTHIEAHVGDQVNVVSDPTARVGVPVGSSKGRTLTNSTLAVRLPGILNTGVVTSTTTSTKDAFGNAEITNTNQIANVNLLNGLIKADALKVTAYGKVDDGKYTSRMEMKLVNLVIAGKAIPIDVSPNTIINVAGLGQVAINRQQVGAYGAPLNRIDGVRITLDTAQAGLPVGAVIELGVASTAIAPPGTY